MNKIVIMFFLAVLIFSAVIVSAQNEGEKEIIINGGKSGNITLPHHLHQDVVDDCMICHVDFPKEAGSIDALKSAGTIKKKQVMNQICLKCHRDKKKAGEKAGPVSCSECHIK